MEHNGTSFLKKKSVTFHISVETTIDCLRL